MKTLPTKQNLLDCLKYIRTDGMEFWKRIDAQIFWTESGTFWSPAENIAHLTSSTRPVKIALNIPRLVLSFLFGQSPSHSRNWELLQAIYLEKLASGATAGRYTPILTKQTRNFETKQKQLINHCERVCLGLEIAVNRWQDNDLDRYLLPHPILGPLTIREMLMFTLFHFEHHRTKVAERFSGKRSIN